MKPRTKNYFVVRSLIAGLAIAALSACTATTPTPEPIVPSAAAASATSSQLGPSETQTATESSDSTSFGSPSPAEPTFSADLIKILEHKIIDDPTAKNLQVKIQAPENTSFFSGTDKAPCESSVIDSPSAAPSSSAATSVPKVTYLLRCQDQNPTTELTASISYGDFDYSFVVPLK